MALYLFIDSGPQKGIFFYLKDQAIIGRRKGSDIHINNPTISAQHAQVEKKNGKTYLNSLSRRGVLVDSCAYERVELKADMIFSIGEISFVLRNSMGNLSDWKSLLLVTFSDLSRQPHISEMASRKVWPFSKRLKLTITQGRQMGIVWYIGYGPRYIGTDSADFPIHEPSLGPCGFTLDPLKESDLSSDDSKKDSGIAFSTQQPSIVQLNGKSIKNKMLHHNDVIQLEDTCLQVQIKDIK